MVSADALRFGVGILGNVISLFLFLSPVPTFMKICKKRSVEQYSSIPYLATFMNCMLWVLYAMPFVKPNSVLVLTINTAGFFIEIVYLSLFVLHANDNRTKLKVVALAAGEAVLVAALAALVLSLAHTAHLRTQVVGMVAIVFNIVIPTFFHICKKGSVERFSPVPYLLGFLNYMLWLVYALPVVRPNSALVLVLGVAGCAIETVYLSLFVVHSNHNKRRLGLIAVVLGEILFVGLVACLVLTLVRTTGSRSRIVGILADVASTLMYGSPLSVMKLVITTKSVEYMPLPLSLATFVNAVVWTIYGLFPFDPYFVAPCGLGAVLGLAQLVLYGVYFRSTKEGMSVDKSVTGRTEKHPSPLPSQNL